MHSVVCLTHFLSWCSDCVNSSFCFKYLQVLCQYSGAKIGTRLQSIFLGQAESAVERDLTDDFFYLISFNFGQPASALFQS